MTALLHGEATQHSIVVRVVLEENLPRVIGSPQLQQVLMSLILNGIDAMKGLERTRELVISSQRDGKTGCCLCQRYRREVMKGVSAESIRRATSCHHRAPECDS